mmetsp:Transcript_3623/g.7096  ORF Transcript_3623/g.7096 Transcript_3623/m.7096 type:complete len:161 (+) Transcript_3623:1-483(+)
MALAKELTNGIQYIACGCCELGPLGFRHPSGTFWVCPDRVVPESSERKARPPPNLSGSEMAEVRAMMLQAEAERSSGDQTYSVDFVDNCSMRLGEVGGYEGATVVLGFLSDDSPAALQGVEPGDIVLKVAGESVARAGWEAVVERINAAARPLQVTFYRG